MAALTTVLGVGVSVASAAVITADAALTSAAAAAAPGEALVARYRVNDDHGGHDMTLVRSGDRVEYRVEGDPIRVWTREAEGVSLRELYPAAARDVVYTPGELRTLEVTPDWRQLSQLIAPDLRASLGARGAGKALASQFGESVIGYSGRDARAVAVELQWLPDADLPLRYRHAGDGKVDALRLVALQQMPVAQAFTDREGLIEIDHADLGDMELDPFVRGLPQAAAPTYGAH